MHEGGATSWISQDIHGGFDVYSPVTEKKDFIRQPEKENEYSQHQHDQQINPGHQETSHAEIPDAMKIHDLAYGL